MYKILVIDDEKSIVKGLVKVLESREELELQVYYAYTVSEGLKIAKEVKLDILCTDINMPIMDGFEFSQSVREYWKECKIVYLTGYGTFDYIYRAVNQYEGKYVLKNEEDEKFIQVIRQCITEIELSKQMKLTEGKMLQITDQNKAYERCQLMTEFLGCKNASESLEMLKSIYEEGPIQIEQDFYIVIGKVLGESYKRKNKEVIYRLIRQVKEQYSYFYEVDEMKLYHNTYLIVIQPKQEFVEKQILIGNMLEEMQTQLLTLYEEKISFIYSNQRITWQKLKDQVKLYNTLLDINLSKHMPILIDIEALMEKNKLEDTNHDQYVLQIDKMIMEKRFLDLKEIFESLYISIKNTYELSLIDTQMYYKCLEKVVSYIEKEINYLELSEELQRGYYHLRYLTGIDEIHQFLVLLLKYLGEDKQLTTETEEDMIIKKIEGYILSSITEEISLTTLAKLVYFNPSYLSRFYKSVTGRNLSQFIKEAKLIKAKELLRTSDKKIGDISKMLGYESVGYFTVFFKKSVGLTPTEYRNHQ